MKRLLSQIAAAIAGLWLAVLLIPEIEVRVFPESSFFGFPITEQWQLFLVLGVILGLLNYYIRPILKALSLPLEIVTFGLFSIVINMGMIWALDLMFEELSVPWIFPLLFLTIIIWLINLIISKIFINNED